MQVCAVASVAEPITTTTTTVSSSLAARQDHITKYFPSALSVDDFITRVEIALCGYGFTGRNSIACTNLCRDEITAVLKDKIETSFGGSFNTNGLGGVLTCGVTGIGAGLSHSPICESSGRERYVFFTFPHIAIDSEGTVGNISRPGRSGTSCACGALVKCLSELKKEGVSNNCKVPGVHDPLDPEYTILKQRLARRIRYEGLDIATMDLAQITAVAEHMITDDLEYLIEKAVDPKKADYAVVAGVQIHNWSTDFDDASPNLEWVAPSKLYVVVNGETTYLDISKIPSLTPRQLQLLASASMGALPENPNVASSITATSTVQEIPTPYLANRLGATNVTSGDASSASQTPDWSSKIVLDQAPNKLEGVPKMDTIDVADMTAALGDSKAVHPSFTDKGLEGLQALLSQFAPKK